MLALSFILELWQLLVPTIGKHGRPMGPICDFVNFYADFGIGAHPLDLLPER
jgi:hypothetical protein